MRKLVFLSVIAISLFSACKKINDPSRDPLVSITLQDTLQMYVGQSRLIPFTTNPAWINKDSLHYYSSDTSVIAFLTAGTATAKKVGTAKISISNFSNTKTVNCTVTVVPAPVDSLKIGLVAYYPFNNSAADSSGNKYDGTAYNLVPTTDRNGNVNSAYYFNGQSSYIQVKDNPQLRLNSTDFTINAWVELYDYNSSYGSIVIDKRDYGSNAGWNFGIAGYGDLNNQVGAYGVVTYSVSGGNDPVLVGVTKIDTAHHWHMITTVYQVGTKKTMLYVDGVQDSYSIGLQSPNLLTNPDIYIGADNPSNYTDYYFEGKIDDIRIYTRALAAGEVVKLFQKTN